MEDLETIFGQKLDRSSEKCKQTRHMNDFRNFFRTAKIRDSIMFITRELRVGNIPR